MLNLLAMVALAQGPTWVTFEGHAGPGLGKRIVLLAGDEEYRSEEALTQLAKILAERHGFTCQVAYSIGKDGTIDPETTDNIPGMKLLAGADLMICMLRWRNLPDDQMSYFDSYVKLGHPIIGFRTSTHAFKIPADRLYEEYGSDSKTLAGGFGKQVLGETWLSHHGNHLVESTRTVIATEATADPILSGVGPIWVPTDVYEAHPPKDAKILLFGAVLENMSPTSKPIPGPKNSPMMPVLWTREVPIHPLKPTRVVTSTMGSSLDFQDENLRRVAVNACYWALQMRVPKKANVDLVGEYVPTQIGFQKQLKGRRPGDF